ncbi:TPA: transposase [Klebsiella aerogenes]|nr:transposase [Klebsiella aerogenes]
MIKPGKPAKNDFIERFNRTYRTEILDFLAVQNTE